MLVEEAQEEVLKVDSFGEHKSLSTVLLCSIYVEEQTEDGKKWCDVDPKTVGQYLGGKANFNKEIYEGDIINIFDLENEKSIQAVVVFSFGCFSVCENGDPQNGTQTLLSLHCEGKTITVIGNIHDNPELLPNE